jgi:hypothetical protein
VALGFKWDNIQAFFHQTRDAQIADDEKPPPT